MDQAEKELLFINHILVHEKAIQKILWLGKASHHVQTHEDLMQNTLLKAWQGLDQINDMTKIKGWLYQIARNEVKLYLRRQQIFHSVHTDPLEISDPLAKDTTDFYFDSDDFGHTMPGIEMQVAIRTLDELDAESKQLVILRYIFGYFPTDIAAMMSIKIGTATSKLARAVKKFRIAYCANMEDMKLDTT